MVPRIFYCSITIFDSKMAIPAQDSFVIPWEMVTAKATRSRFLSLCSVDQLFCFVRLLRQACSADHPENQASAMCSSAFFLSLIGMRIFIVSGDAQIVQGEEGSCLRPQEGKTTGGAYEGDASER